MSLAPASSLGAFLKARFAVKGIQWAARSFGTLTAARRGLLSSMGASCVLGCGGYRASYQLRCDTGTPPGLFFRPIGRGGGGGGAAPPPRDRQPRSRTLRRRNPRYPAITAVIAEMRLRAIRGHGRSHITARPVASNAARPPSECGG